MYKIGQKVMYLSKRLMYIFNIEEKCFQENDIKNYYVLKDLKDPDSVIYLPVDSPLAYKNIRPLLTKKEIDESIDSSFYIDSLYESSYKDRVQKYNELIKSGDIKNMLSVIKMLLLKKEQLTKDKKSLSNVDAICLKDLINSIEDEFSVVLKISPSDVGDYINDRLKKMNENN